MALSKHTDHNDINPETNNATDGQYPHDAQDKGFSGNDEHELLNADVVMKGKEKYLGDIANIEDVRGNGGEPVDENSLNLTQDFGQHDGANAEKLKSDLNNTGLRGL